MKKVTNSEQNLSSKLSLTEDELEQIEKFGALDYPIKKMCLILGIKDKKNFEDDLNNENSEIYQHYWKGHYQAEFIIENSLMDDAKCGKIEAVKIIQKRKENKRIEMLKRKLDEQLKENKQ